MLVVASGPSRELGAVAPGKGADSTASGASRAMPNALTRVSAATRRSRSGNRFPWLRAGAARLRATKSAHAGPSPPYHHAQGLSTQPKPICSTLNPTSRSADASQEEAARAPAWRGGGARQGRHPAPHRGPGAPAVRAGHRVPRDRHLAGAAHHGRVRRGLRRAGRGRPGGHHLRLGARRPPTTRSTAPRARRGAAAGRGAASRSSPAAGRGSWRPPTAAPARAAALSIGCSIELPFEQGAQPVRRPGDRTSATSSCARRCS